VAAVKTPTFSRRIDPFDLGRVSQRAGQPVQVVTNAVKAPYTGRGERLRELMCEGRHDLAPSRRVCREAEAAMCSGLSMPAAAWSKTQPAALQGNDLKVLFEQRQEERNERGPSGISRI
jgi:hypothetical protein